MSASPRVYRRVEFPLGVGPEVISLLHMEDVIKKARELGAPDSAEITRPRNALIQNNTAVFAVEWETGE